MRPALFALSTALILTACQTKPVSQTVVLTPEPGAQVSAANATQVASSQTAAATQPAPQSSPLAQPVSSQPATISPSPASPAASPAPAPSSATVVTVVENACALPPEPLRFVKPPAIPAPISGRVGLFVGRLSRGTKEFRFDRATWLNPQWQFPLASNFKTSVLYQLLQAVDRGKISLTEKFNVTRANRSYGRYPYDGSDAMTLAMQMIQWSDNTATDILVRRLGLGELQPLAQSLNLCNTRLLLPTKAWWAAEAGYGGADFPKYGLVSASRKFAAAPFASQVKMAQRLDAAAQRVGADDMRRALDFGYFIGRNGGVDSMSQIDRNLQNASTPQEWARLLHHAFVNSDLSAVGQKRFQAVMSKGKGRGDIHVPFKVFGGKSGNTARVLTYSGYLETLSGDKLIYVYMNDSSRNLSTRDETPQAFKLINAALKAVMRPEDLIRRKPTPPAPPAPVSSVPKSGGGNP